MRKRFTVYLILATMIVTLFTVSCKKKKDDNSLILLLALYLLQDKGCENQSGLVICIPPGLRQ